MHPLHEKEDPGKLLSCQDKSSYSELTILNSVLLYLVNTRHCV